MPTDRDDEMIDSNLDPELPDDEQPTEYEIEHKMLKTPLLMLPDIAFFTPGRDAGGASERIFVRVTPRMRDWLASYTNDKRFPFKGLNHLARWCIEQGLRKLDRIRPTPTLTTQIAAMQNVLYEEEIAAAFAQVFAQAEARISHYLQDGAKGEACRVVASLRHEIDGIPDGYWKGKYKREIQTRWGDLLKGSGVEFGTEGNLGEEQQAQETPDGSTESET